MSLSPCTYILPIYTERDATFCWSVACFSGTECGTTVQPTVSLLLDKKDRVREGKANRRVGRREANTVRLERERETVVPIGDIRTLHGSVGSVTLRHLTERLHGPFFHFGLVDRSLFLFCFTSLVSRIGTCRSFVFPFVRFQLLVKVYAILPGVYSRASTSFVFFLRAAKRN